MGSFEEGFRAVRELTTQDDDFRKGVLAAELMNKFTGDFHNALVELYGEEYSADDLYDAINDDLILDLIKEQLDKKSIDRFINSLNEDLEEDDYMDDEEEDPEIDGDDDDMSYDPEEGDEPTDE